MQIIDHQSGRALTSIDIKAAKREVHPGAIYLHDATLYQCLSLDLDKRVATIEAVNTDHFTEPWGPTTVEVLLERHAKAFGRTSAHFGSVKVTSIISAYKKLHFTTRQSIGAESLQEPLCDELDTEGCWLFLPANVAQSVVRFMNAGMRREKDESTGMIRATKSIAEIRVMATHYDIGGCVCAIPSPATETLVPALVLYDQYPAGLGFAEKIHTHIEDVLRDAISFVKRCRCQEGCPICVGSRHINKLHVIWVLENLFEESTPKTLAAPPGVTPSIGRPRFAWSEIQDKWPEIVGNWPTIACRAACFSNASSYANGVAPDSCSPFPGLLSTWSIDRR